MKKILIVDDNAQNLYMLEILLKTNGFEVEQASNGAVALELAHQNPPEIIISDILMPIMDGFSLCRSWMADERLKRIPFIFYTATYTDHKDEVFALSLGADRFLVKPTAPDDLLLEIQEVLRKHQTRETTVLEKQAEQEDLYYKEYSQVLIHKLEDKMSQLEQMNKRLSALYQASCNLVTIKSSPELVHWILRDIVETAGYQQVNYFQFNEQDHKLHLSDAVGFSEKSLTVFKDFLVFNLGEEKGLVGLVAQSRQSMIIGDTTQNPNWMALDPTIHSALFVPVHYKERLLGVIALFSVERNAFKAGDERNLTSFANSLAVSIENIKNEEALRKSEFEYRLLADHMNEMVWLMDLNLKTLYASPSVEKLLGYADSEIEARPLEKQVTPTSFQQVVILLRKALAQAQVQPGCAFVETLEIEFYRQNGSAFWSETTFSLICDQTGQPVSILGEGRDITERKRAAEEILKLNARLEQRVAERTAQLENSNKELEAFAYSVSHDLRAPLRGIDGWSLVLLEDYSASLDKTGQSYLKRVRSETQRMSLLIDDLLGLSRVTRAEMQIAPVDLSKLVQNIITRLQGTYPERQVDFVVQPGLMASGDSALLAIALTNLLDNALKFTGKSLDARIEFGQIELNSRIPFFVRDNGIGFDMTYAGKLFGAFQRFHKATDFPGTGVGLATVQRIIHRHGGQIWVDAHVNQGATFFFTLGEGE